MYITNLRATNLKKIFKRSITIAKKGKKKESYVQLKLQNVEKESKTKITTENKSNK